MPARIDKWNIRTSAGAFTTNEVPRRLLTGYLTGHPKFGEGSHYFVSLISAVDWDNRQVVTPNNIEIAMGQPSEEFLEWLRLNDYFRYLPFRPHRQEAA